MRHLLLMLVLLLLLLRVSSLSPQARRRRRRHELNIVTVVATELTRWLYEMADPEQQRSMDQQASAWWKERKEKERPAGITKKTEFGGIAS